jgi:hypothetical protein
MRFRRAATGPRDHLPSPQPRGRRPAIDSCNPPCPSMHLTHRRIKSSARFLWRSATELEKLRCLGGRPRCAGLT